MNILLKYKPGYLGRSRTANSYSSTSSSIYPGFHRFACCNEIKPPLVNGMLQKNAFSQKTRSATISCWFLNSSSRSSRV